MKKRRSGFSTTAAALTASWCTCLNKQPIATVQLTRWLPRYAASVALRWKSRHSAAYSVSAGLKFVGFIKLWKKRSLHTSLMNFKWERVAAAVLRFRKRRLSDKKYLRKFGTLSKCLSSNLSFLSFNLSSGTSKLLLSKEDFGSDAEYQPIRS